MQSVRKIFSPAIVVLSPITRRASLHHYLNPLPQASTHHLHLLKFYHLHFNSNKTSALSYPNNTRKNVARMSGRPSVFTSQVCSPRGNRILWTAASFLPSKSFYWFGSSSGPTSHEDNAFNSLLGCLLVFYLTYNKKHETLC